MMRILHVIDQGSTTGPTLTLKLAADLATQDATEHANQHAWLLIGGGPLRDAARSAGIDEAHTVRTASPRRLRIPGAMNSVKRLLSQADRVECWSPGAASIVSSLGRIDAVSRFGQATLSPLTRAVIADSLTQLGAAVRSRDEVRSRWEVPDHAVMIALLADQPDTFDMRSLILPLAFTFESLDAIGSPYREVRLVCHPDTPGRSQVIELAQLLGFPLMVIQDAGLLTPWDTLQGCELTLAPRPVQAGLSIAWAQAMGKPIIAPDEPCLPGLADVQGLIHADSSAPKHLAKAMTDWARALPEPAWSTAPIT